SEAVMSMAVNEDAQETGQKAFNYRTEPIWFRHGYKPESHPTQTRQITDYDQVMNNAYIGGLDPVTPVFTANAGDATRFRVVHPGGHTQQHVWQISGHEFQKIPYTVNSTVIGSNGNSPVVGSRNGVGPTDHFDSVLRFAGGINRVTGDYHYGDYVPWYLVNGLWGIFRVE
ncbi:MAG: hypothetical protein KDD47_19140, partial [Acidobacteria bacterium]|nr:hypothetical protein [Acidobacteriota bacterium]